MCASRTALTNTGPSPNNTNLAIKGILGLASYSMLEGYLGWSNASVMLQQSQAFVADWLVQVLCHGHHITPYSSQAAYEEHYMRQCMVNA